MYDTLPANIRDAHPYFMYEEIKAQPQAVGRSLQLVAEHGAPIAAAIARARRVYVTGCGTSFHAAEGGAWFLGALSQGQIDAYAVQAYELVTYPPRLRPDDVVVAVTHSGTTFMTLQALELAQQAGAENAVITGFPDSAAAKLARHVLPTGYNDELSWAHTVSYTAALASLAAIANTLAAGEERLDLTPLSQIVAEALQLEEMMHRLAGGAIVAERYRDQLDIVLIGGGPNAATAREGELKLLETSYGPATAFELEQSLHGPLASIDEDALVIIIAPSGRTSERAAELTRALRELGVVPAVLVTPGNADAFEHTHRFVLPEVPELLSPIPCVVPLQFFSYFLALGKGYNPDLIRRDDERYRAASAQYR